MYNMRVPPRKPGRPSQPLVNQVRLLKTALQLLEEGGADGVTMRALAERLGVNPMAAYHYFDSKEALLRAAAGRHYRQFRPRLDQADPPARLLALGLAYGRFLRASRQLLSYLVTNTQAAMGGPVAHFDGLFSRALGSLRLSLEERHTARNAFVDLVHGFALAGTAAPLHLLADELRLLIAGITRRL